MRGSQLYAAVLCGALCYVAPIANAIEPDLTEKKLKTTKLDEDMYELSIDAGRLGAVLQRATEAADHLRTMTPPYEVASPLGVDVATKEAAAQLLIFRNMLLARNLPGGNREIEWPKWMFEPPTAKHSQKTLDARVLWLSREVEAIVDPVCEAAKERTKDLLICSVE